jgi:glycosyltransferase involved in cell wall biosynthesis
MHKVAIGMPVWNGENFISEAIESILAQTYGDLELVISDNASSDATAEICRGYVKRDTRIRYIRQEKNMGAAPNYIEVFRRSSGQYFKWAAHDDVLAPEFIQECVRVLDADETVVVCSPATMLINEDGSPIRFSLQDKAMVDSHGTMWPVTPEKNMLLTSADPADRFAAVLLNMIMCLEIFGLMRRSTLERTSVQPSHVGGDKVVLAELSLIGRFHLLEEYLFYRRCHPGQFSHARSGNYRAMWFSGKKDSVFSHQMRLLAGYTRAALSAKLTPEQRYRCVSAICRRAVTRGKPLKRMLFAVAPPQRDEFGSSGSIQTQTSLVGSSKKG